MDDDDEDPIDEAVDEDAHNYLEAEDERRSIRYIPAIRKSLAKGKTPKEIARRFKKLTKGERQGYTLRIEQAARHILRTDPPEVGKKPKR